MLVLALDTSTPAVTVAVASVPDLGQTDVADVRRAGASCLAEHIEVAANRHGELLAPMVARCLREAGVDRRELGLVAVGAGPGPFTGLRVGLVTAATLADAIGIAVRAVCSLDVVAHGEERPWDEGFTVVTDARRREVYWATYRDDGSGRRRVAGPAVDQPHALVSRLPVGTKVAGAAALLYSEAFASASIDARAPYPKAGVLAELAVLDEWAVPPLPIYLRRPDARPPGPPKPVTATR